MLHRVPKGVILVLGLYCLLLVASLLAPKLLDTYLLQLLELPLFGFLFFWFGHSAQHCGWRRSVYAFCIFIWLCTSLSDALAYSSTS